QVLKVFIKLLAYDFPIPSCEAISMEGRHDTWMIGKGIVVYLSKYSIKMHISSFSWYIYSKNFLNIIILRKDKIICKKLNRFKLCSLADTNHYKVFIDI